MKNYFRTIPALLPKSIQQRIPQGQLAYRISSFFFLFFLILAGILLQILVYLNTQSFAARNQHELKDKEYTYWNGVATQYPLIPDILYNAALSSLNDGRYNEALNYINKALQIDPQFKKARELKKEIEK